MTDIPPKNGTAQVVEFPKGEDERARRLLALVKWRSEQSKSEWVLYLDDDARKHEIEPGKLKAMIEAAVEEREKKAREDRDELQRAEKQRATARRESERKQKEEREEAKRQAKELAHKAKERAKELQVIARLPSVAHELRLIELSKRLDISIEFLREELQRLED
jgi:hypothetical protein